MSEETTASAMTAQIEVEKNKDYCQSCAPLHLRLLFLQYSQIQTNQNDAHRKRKRIPCSLLWSSLQENQFVVCGLWAITGLRPFSGNILYLSYFVEDVVRSTVETSAMSLTALNDASAPCHLL